MANKSITVAAREERSTVKPSAIQKVLRHGAALGVAAGIMVGANEAKAQLATNTVSLAPIGISLFYAPATGTPFSNMNGFQPYDGFDPSLGTLDSVILSLTVSYTIDDTIHAGNNTYQGTDIMPLSPIVESTGVFNGTTYSGTGNSGGLIYASPAALFPYDISQNTIDPSQSGTFTYSQTFDVSSLSAGSIGFLLPSDYSLAPDAPVQNFQSIGAGDSSTINLQETVSGTIQEVYTEPTPEPSSLALASLGGVAALLMLRRRRS